MGMSSPKLPTLTLSGCYLVDIESLYESIKHLDTMSCHIKIFADKDGLRVEGLSDVDNYTGKFPGTCHDWNDEKGYIEVHTIFSLDYFTKVLLAYRKMKFQDIWLQIGHDYPGIFEVEENGTDYDFHDRFILAPRIENE
jgi:hypothetical protein